MSRRGAWHALRFPNGWTETAAASLSLSAAWILLAALASGTGPFGFLLGLPVVLIAVAILFFQLVARIPDWITLGTPAPISTRTTRRTALPPEKAERAITLWPGREDARTSTGEPDETGAGGRKPLPCLVLRRWGRLASGCRPAPVR